MINFIKIFSKFRVCPNFFKGFLKLSQLFPKFSQNFIISKRFIKYFTKFYQFFSMFPQIEPKFFHNFLRISLEFLKLFPSFPSIGENIFQIVVFMKLPYRIHIFRKFTKI